MWGEGECFCEAALLALTENWKRTLDDHKVDMSKAFDSLYHPLTLAKLRAYGVKENSRKLLDSYFTDQVSRGCLQGSALGPLVWNIFQNDLAYSVDTSLNMYADDHQLYATGSTITDVHEHLMTSAESASRWYNSNFLKGNWLSFFTVVRQPGNRVFKNLNISMISWSRCGIPLDFLRSEVTKVMNFSTLPK